SILVVLDHHHRDQGKGGVRPLSGSFNPCCPGSPSPGDEPLEDRLAPEHVSILVVVDHHHRVVDLNRLMHGASGSGYPPRGTKDWRAGVGLSVLSKDLCCNVSRRTTTDLAVGPACFYNSWLFAAGRGARPGKWPVPAAFPEGRASCPRGSTRTTSRLRSTARPRPAGTSAGSTPKATSGAR